MSNSGSNLQVQNPRILIVNDQPAICENIRAILEVALEFQTECVQTSEMAIRRLLTRKYDLIILDSRLPEVHYSSLPADIEMRYRATPDYKFVRGREVFFSEGERLFRFFRSAETADIKWETDVQSAPVIFITGGVKTLNRGDIYQMPPVAIFSTHFEIKKLIDQTMKMLGRNQ